MILLFRAKLKPLGAFVGLSLAAVCLCLSAAAQTSNQPSTVCKPDVKSAACGTKTPDAKTPDPKDSSGSTAPVPLSTAFPFPVEDSKHAGDATPKVPANGLPAMPTGPTPDPPASSEQPMKLPPGYPGSSSSEDGEAPPGGSSSSRSAADDDIAPTTPAPDAPIKSSALKDLGSRGDTSITRAKLEKTRVADDLKVGSFYMKDGNVQGAYLRFKDAVDHAPDDPNTRFNLAEAAGKLNKQDEAVTNYQAYLRLDAGGDHDKASRKALGKLGATVQ